MRGCRGGKQRKGLMRQRREKDVEEVGGGGRDNKIGMMRDTKITTTKTEQGQQE